MSTEARTMESFRLDGKVAVVTGGARIGARHLSGDLRGAVLVFESWTIDGGFCNLRG